MKERLLSLRNEVLGELKAFQRATVERIARIFRDRSAPHHRVLVADEVGLGKTMIARGVIADLALLRFEENDTLFKVVYVCSNQAIARQNIRKLKISDDNQIDNSVAETRLSMQHLRVLEQEKECEHKTFIQLTPLTPGTSFQITNSQGSAPERALMYCLLRRKMGDSVALSDFLRWGVNRENWKNMCARFENRIAKVDRDNYPASFIAQFDRALLADLQNHLAETGTKNIQLIVRLRRMFAELSAARLQPDLVIMDEFQRFQNLLNPKDDDDLKILTEKFLRCAPAAADPPRILLLSATPYKLYSTLDEIDARQCDEPFAEFMQVVEFLLEHDADRIAAFSAVWQRYSRELQALKRGEIPDLETKQCAENRLYDSGMCRTERISFVTQGDFLESIPEKLDVREGDILGYVSLNRVLERLKIPAVVPYDFVKSSPYLMSFMDTYQLKKLIGEHAKSRTARESVKGKMLWLKESAVNNYEAIPAVHAKYECLRKYAFENHAERLLWIPPSMPYYEPRGVFRAAEDFSKLLVFSAWEMVPRMIASLISYDAECRTNGELCRRKKRREPGMGSLHYCRKDRFPRGKLFSRKKKSDAPQGDLLSREGEILRCRSEFLEGCFTPGSQILDPDELRSQVREKIATELSRLGLTDYPAEENPYCYLARRLDRFPDTGSETRLPLPDAPETVLADMAIAAPGICIARTLYRMKGTSAPGQIEAAISSVTNAVLRMFDAPEGIGAVAERLKDLDDYPERVLQYCFDGNFQAMFDEYFFLLDPRGKEKIEDVADTMTMALNIRTATYEADTYDAFVNGDRSRRIGFRSHYAVGFNKSTKDRGDSESAEAADRKESVRTAFNSPFRPFVLASTSVGQEGLDFHFYCRRIMHWNLPGNPAELEQREGRINRYLCHAVRKSMVDCFRRSGDPPAAFSWPAVLDAAEVEEKRRSGDHAELAPFWCFSRNQPVKIQRIVPMYPFSRDEAIYRRLLKLLSLYRLTLGQARQEEILESILESRSDTDALARDLFISLCPFCKERP